MLSRPVTPEGMGSMFPASAGRGAPAGSHPAPPEGTGSRPVTPEGVGPRPTTPEGMGSVFQGPPVLKVRMPVGSFRPNLPSRPAPTLLQRAPSQASERRAEAPVVSVATLGQRQGAPTNSGPRQGAPSVRPSSSGQAVSVTASGAGDYTNNLVLKTRIAQLSRKGKEQQEEYRKLEEEYRKLVARLPHGVTSEGGPNQPDGVETAAPGDGVAVPNGDDVHDGADSGDDAASLASNFSRRGQRGSSLSVSFAPDEGIEQIIPPGARVETEVSFVPGSGDGSQEGEQSGPDPLQSDPVVVSNAAELQGGDVLGPGRHEQRRFPGIPNLRELMTEASPSRVRALTLRDETVALAESEMFPSGAVDRSHEVPLANESPDSSYRAVGVSLSGPGIQSSTPVIPGTVLRGQMGSEDLGVTPVIVEESRVEQSQRVARSVPVAAGHVGRRNSLERERLQSQRREAVERLRLQAENRNARFAARRLPKDLPGEVLQYSHVEVSTDDSDNGGGGTSPHT